MNKDLIHLIEKEYQIRINDYHPLKKAWVLQTNRGPFFLKSFVFRDGPRLQFIDGAMRHLIKRGFNHIIPFKRTKKGDPYISYAKEIYFMTPYIKARQCNYNNPDELSKAASLLAELHLASFGYRPSPDLNPQYFWGLWPRRFKEKIQHLYTFKNNLEKKANLDQFDQIFIEKFSYYFQKAHQALDQLLKSDYQRLMFNEQRFHSFCHHDYEYHNLLITPENHYYVIDFDYLLCDTHLHDLASLLIRAGRRSKWDEKKRELVIRAYHQIYPIHPEEIPIIQAMMLFPQVYWQVAFARYFENQPWPLERFINDISRKTKYEKARVKYIENLNIP
ncbi:hypothetical protein BBF96_10470 [Anoxybacter fermentans]|uniref:Aminoglycoside phosphotransferase domain-containing protein n=1 Tax=Anoxybacter fermentans TaxID=1323375 RepID=A0A3S9T027_9FIRM|nr:CotS family spore coat protein [Anoxybacter fermentans]AZR73772.1 hypothetical protein BBF96_10470 [Anoxybacter fermentans]